MDLTIDRNLWPDIVRRTSGHLLAYGWPGTGKSWDFSMYAREFTTSKIARMAKRINDAGKPVDQTLLDITHFEVNCTRQTSAAGWLGHWIDGGPRGFLWNHGPVARAMILGVPLVINDAHLCSDDLFDLLFFVLDDPKRAVYSLPNGDQLRAAKGFRALLSINGDPIQVFDEPIRDRLQAKFEINVPSEGALHTLDPDARKNCRDLYKAARVSPPPFTFRQYQAFCSLRRELGNAQIAARLICDSETDARAFIEAILITSGTIANEGV